MLTWTHSDPALVASVADGLAMLQAGDFTMGPSTAQVRNFQAVCALKALLVGHLMGSVSYDTQPDGITTASVSGDLSVPGERGDFARALIGPIAFYYAGAGLSPMPDESLFTEAPVEAGIWPLAVIIAVSIAGAAVAGWAVTKAAEVIKYFHSTDVQTKEIQRLDGAVTDAVNRHVQAEVKAGKVIAMSDEEKAHVAALNSRLSELTKQLAPPAAPGFFESLPWYAWAGAGAVIVVLVAASASRGGASLVMVPAKAA